MIAWAAEAMAASALLIVLVLLARAPVRRAFGAGAAYGLWALPALRLVLPPLPAWHRAAVPPLAMAGERASVLVLPAAPADSRVPFESFIAAWLIGAALLFVWQGVAYARFRRRVLAGAVPLTRVGRVRIVASTHAPGPVAFGVFRPAVAVPLGWEARFDAEARELAIAHELAHHARGDLVANWAALAVLALHWFNPVAWCAYRAFRSDQEQATDARVLAATAASPRAYARCIVTAASGRTLSPACHLTTLTDLKRKLHVLTRPLPTRRRVHAGIVGTAALAAAGLGLTTASNATEPANPAAHRLRAHLARAEQPARMATMAAMASMPEVPTPPTRPPPPPVWTAASRSPATATPRPGDTASCSATGTAA